jgi:hypothetical protein
MRPGVGKHNGQAIKPGRSHVYGYRLLSLYRLFSVSLPTRNGKPLQEVVSRWREIRNR